MNIQRILYIIFICALVGTMIMLYMVIDQTKYCTQALQAIDEHGGLKVCQACRILGEGGIITEKSG